jgi:integrase
VLQRIRSVLDWARASGLRSGDNPVDGVSRVLPKQKDTETHYAALPYIKIASFIKKLREENASEPAKLAFEFMILTAARTSEVLNVTWHEIDAKAATWTIPVGRMKVGREHRVPLAPRSLAILKKAKELAGESDYIFPSKSATQPLSNMVFLMLLRRNENCGNSTRFPAYNSELGIRTNKFSASDLPPLAVPVDWQEVRLQG